MKKLLFIAVTLVTLIGLSGCVESSGKYKALQAKLDSLQVNYNVQGAELDEIFVAAANAGAQRIMLPIESKEKYDKLKADLKKEIEIIYYSTPLDAAKKALSY